MSKVSLFDVIAWIESRNCTRAIRFEPATFARVAPGRITTAAQSAILAKIKRIHNCSDGTAAMLYSTSFGAVQDMGFNIWAGNSFNGSFVDFLEDPDAQSGAFIRFCLANNLADITPEILAFHRTARLKFSITYNGSIAYADFIIAALHHFGYVVSP